MKDRSLAPAVVAILTTYRDYIKYMTEDELRNIILLECYPPLVTVIRWVREREEDERKRGAIFATAYRKQGKKTAKKPQAKSSSKKTASQSADNYIVTKTKI